MLPGLILQGAAFVNSSHLDLPATSNSDARPLSFGGDEVVLSDDGRCVSCDGSERPHASADAA
jgi:hypothetical protein